MTAHSQRARRALAHLPQVDPAIAALSLWCAHRDGTLATRTEGEVIRYGPAFDTFALPEQTGLVAHHVLHVALRHSARAQAMAQRLGEGFNAGLYALAADALVNEVLLQGGHVLPRPAVRAADLVARLPDAPTPDQVLADWDTDRLYLAIAGLAGQGGQAARDAAESYAREMQFTPDLDAQEAAPETPPEAWTTRIEAALDAGRGAGAGIGPVLSRFADLAQPSLPWEVHLRGLIAKAISQIPRLSHKRPARGWIAREATARAAGTPSPVFEPGFARDRRRPKVVVGLDTSSSITPVQLNFFAAEALGIAHRSGAEMHLLAFDTEVHARLSLTEAQDLTLDQLRSGGGTDFAPVMTEASQLDPSVLVMLSDVDAHLPPRPAFPVIWAAPKAPVHRPDYGTLLVMDR